jgi:hypothetical protein
MLTQANHSPGQVRFAPAGLGTRTRAVAELEGVARAPFLAEAALQEQPEVPRAVPAIQVEGVLLDRTVALEHVHEVDVRGGRQAKRQRVRAEGPLEPRVLEVGRVENGRLEVALAVHLQPHPEGQRLRQRVVVGEVQAPDPETVLVLELVTVVPEDAIVVAVEEATDPESGGCDLLCLGRGRRRRRLGQGVRGDG